MLLCLVTPQVIQEELGRPVGEVYSEITPEPVAAASLGQVRGMDTYVIALDLAEACCGVLWRAVACNTCRSVPLVRHAAPEAF